MGVNINEAGANEESAGVEFVRGRRVRQIPNGGDAVAADGDIGGDYFAAEAVSNLSAAQNGIQLIDLHERMLPHATLVITHIYNCAPFLFASSRRRWIG